MNILSIQSSVAFGHVGNSAAVLPLQRLGHEVFPINTVQFSNHTGYGAWRGQVFPAEHIADLVQGLEERGALAQCHAVLSGYLGNAATGLAILDAVQRVRRHVPGALYCCDPVMGDEGRGLFVPPDIPPFFLERALPVADLITPNQFELELLAGAQVVSLADAVDAARSLCARGPSLVAVTSLRQPAAGPGRLGNLLVTADGVWLAETPALPFPVPPNGTGDMFAALLLGHLTAGETPSAALESTVGSVYAVLSRTLAAGRRELALVASQDDLAAPRVVAPAVRIG